MLQRYPGWQPSHCPSCYRDGSPFPAVLRELGVTQLYHLTSIPNLPGIVRDGLRPRATLDDAGFTDIAMNDALDHRDRYQFALADGTAITSSKMVPLFFAAKTPMSAKRSKNADRCLIVVNVDRLFAQTIQFVFCDGNLASGPRRTTIYHHTEMLQHLDMRIINAPYWNDQNASEDINRERRRKRSAEFLISPTIPPAAFDYIAFPTSQERREAFSHKYSHPVMTRIEPDLFIR